ncbi:hypothetical protein HY968_04495 [Candidatus Kaiserbacteria bacterium]|nr:hypothetical protein [Candidatus Kaiserbacteria bacterium]
MRTVPSNIITIEEAGRQARKIPDAWKKVQGILKGKRYTDPVAYQRSIRSEWGQGGSAEVPAIWRKVFGMMKGKRRLDPVKVQREMRKAWDKRLHRQVKLGRKKHVTRH